IRNARSKLSYPAAEEPLTQSYDITNCWSLSTSADSSWLTGCVQIQSRAIWTPACRKLTRLHSQLRRASARPSLAVRAFRRSEYSLAMLCLATKVSLWPCMVFVRIAMRRLQRGPWLRLTMEVDFRLWATFESRALLWTVVSRNFMVQGCWLGE